MKKGWIIGILVAALLLAVGVAAAEGLTVTGCSTDSSGHITLSWRGGTAPYRVSYCVKGYESEGLWGYKSGLYSRSITMEDFAPDTSYVFYVIDSRSERATTTRTAYRRQFSGVSGMRLTVTPREKIRGRASTISGYSANRIKSSLFNSQESYGATIKFSYDRLSRAATVYCRMALVMPSGEPIVFACGDLRLEARTGGSGYSYFDFYDFDTAWRIINDAFKDIPTGTYAYRLYLDDGYVGEKTFTVSR